MKYYILKGDLFVVEDKKNITFFGKTFWDLFFMKIFRNFASVKYQWLLLLYIPTIWGMFHIREFTGEPWITPTVGFTFLGGGFVTLALGRIMARTKLTDNEEFDTDK
jgi:hypothetical protein